MPDADRLGHHSLHLRGTDTVPRGCLADALSGSQGIQDAFLVTGHSPSPAQGHSLRPGPLQTRSDPLLDHGSLELCEHLSLVKTLSAVKNR